MHHDPTAGLPGGYTREQLLAAAQAVADASRYRSSGHMAELALDPVTLTEQLGYAPLERAINVPVPYRLAGDSEGDVFARAALNVKDATREHWTGTAAAAAPEAYVDRREMARLLGIGLTTLDEWVRQGMPSETWGLRTRRFLPSQAIAWARARADRSGR